ncbi:MAG: SufD family Fe-S cluster assembly protein [Candidatus Dependentiae bacterium]|nr:SufD family Fe-S cluster assembly protein [Candidatus Dependentiae bacterium]
MTRTITVPAGTSLNYLYDQRQENVIDGICVINFHLERDSTLHCFMAITDDAVSAITLNVFLDGERAQATVRGVYALRDAHKVTITTLQHHRAAHTTSDLIFKGALSGHAQAFYHGTIYVDQQAKKTRSLQKNHTLLLSKTAKSVSVPSLEVLTHDVHCTHGTAAGYLDAQTLFYAQSRGLDMEQARRMVLEGFFAQMLEGLSTSVVVDIYKRIATIGL